MKSPEERITDFMKELKAEGILHIMFSLGILILMCFFLKASRGFQRDTEFTKCTISVQG